MTDAGRGPDVARLPKCELVHETIQEVDCLERFVDDEDVSVILDRALHELRHLQLRYPR